MWHGSVHYSELGQIIVNIMFMYVSRVAAWEWKHAQGLQRLHKQARDEGNATREGVNETTHKLRELTPPCATLSRNRV